MEGFRRGSEQGLEPPLMKIGVDGRSIMVLKLYSIYWAFEPLLILCASTWMYKACQCAAFQHNHAGAGPVQSFTCSSTNLLDYTKQPAMSTLSSMIGTGLLQSRENRSRSHHTSSPMASKSSSQHSDSHGTQ